MWDTSSSFWSVVATWCWRPTSGQHRLWQKSFELAIGDWGGGDLKDLVAGAEYLERRGVAGRGRIGVAGASYGGYMTLMAMTKTPECWAAGVSIVGIVNLHLCTTTTRRPAILPHPAVGNPEDNPGLYWDRSP
jgi:dipeptidyl aminopeptidase/acylaminoacyl peptidase